MKISSPEPNIASISFQSQLLKHLEDKPFVSPKIIPDRKGESTHTYIDDNDRVRIVRLLSWIEGRVWNQVNPITDHLLTDLGRKAGEITKALESFKHEFAQRDFEWDIAHCLWVEDHLDIFDEHRRKLVEYFIHLFKASQAQYDQLRKSVVHNDVNDNNIIVSEDLLNPSVHAIIDFGDAVETQVINDVAISCAYAIMGFNDPLNVCIPILRSYHDAFPIQAKELDHLYHLIAMRLVVSVTKSTINKIAQPDNAYLQASDKGAWELLSKWREISADLALYTFRYACGYEPHPHYSSFTEWAHSQSLKLSDLFPTIKKDSCHLLDLSVQSSWLGNYSEVDDLDLFDFKLMQTQKSYPSDILAGGYKEIRPLYNSDEYDTELNAGWTSRTVHIGVDFWLPAGTPVHALFDGEIFIAANDKGYKEYGGLIVLKHNESDIEFFTLHGHLSLSSIQNKKPGDKISKGECIGFLGNREENGYWSPHLHFQIMLSTLDYVDDFPGVVYYDQLDVWSSICPDPNLLFNIESLHSPAGSSNEYMLSFRASHLGKGMSLQYKSPLKIVRGKGVFLIDQYGDKYLDTVNNVAHVGHEHPEVVKAGQEQMAILNTNSRYLHDQILQTAQDILDTMPPELSVVHFVNSGSEANELAIRMARTATGLQDIIVSEIGYHGNTNMCVDISSYKFDGKGGQGKPDFVHVFPLPDTYRGKYTGSHATKKYLKELSDLLSDLVKNQKSPAALILETIISCGGQIELPEGFLKKAYKSVRENGGLCIADEVQTGCGRVGHSFWAFQMHDVVPDIVTVGKPLGNGHPVAAVVCTNDVADRFANGMEYFNTFGGNPVSCAIASSVLNVISRDSLQSHARELGEYFKSELRELAQSFPIIGDVRGQGLFLGIELVDRNKNPLADQADYLVNRMKQFKILMSTDGKDHNVIKIKPPMVIKKKHVDHILKYLHSVLQEDYMSI